MAFDLANDPTARHQVEMIAQLSGGELVEAVDVQALAGVLTRAVSVAPPGAGSSIAPGFVLPGAPRQFPPGVIVIVVVNLALLMMIILARRGGLPPWRRGANGVARRWRDR